MQYTLRNLKVFHELSSAGGWEAKRLDEHHHIVNADAAQCAVMKTLVPIGGDSSEIESNACFTALAHNMMPDILQAITMTRTLLEQIIVNGDTTYPVDALARILNKLGHP